MNTALFLNVPKMIKQQSISYDLQKYEYHYRFVGRPKLN